MSRIVDEAVVARSRWQGQHPGQPKPVVRIMLVSGETWCFNGIAVAPSLQAPGVAVASSAGLGGATVVVRDQDVFLVEIEPLGAEVH